MIIKLFRQSFHPTLSIPRTPKVAFGGEVLTIRRQQDMDVEFLSIIQRSPMGTLYPMMPGIETLMGYIKKLK